MRLDKYLVENGYFDSRTKAQNEIKEGHVLLNGSPILKSNYEYVDGIITINNPLPYVSRGGYKLEGAIKQFNLDFEDKVILDIGASTGGFTDCALCFKAKKVYSVDVGTSQLAEKLRNDPRVVSYEQTNIVDFKPTEKIDILVMDVSFVSIIKLLPALDTLLNEDNYLVCLIKPQFEVGQMINKGIIKDKKLHLEVLCNVKNKLEDYGLFINKLAPSPIKGGSGNIEFISLISRKKKGNINYLSIVNEAHRKE